MSQRREKMLRKRISEFLEKKLTGGVLIGGRGRRRKRVKKKGGVLIGGRKHGGVLIGGKHKKRKHKESDWMKLIKKVMKKTGLSFKESMMIASDMWDKRTGKVKPRFKGKI